MGRLGEGTCLLYANNVVFERSLKTYIQDLKSKREQLFLLKEDLCLGCV